MIELDNLKKALEADSWCQECGQEHIRPAVEQLIKALEPTVAELNDEYLRDTHVEGMPKEPYNLVAILNDPMKAYPHNFSTPAKGNALLFGLCQEAADEIERLKAETQEPTKEEILGKVFDAVYAQYQPKAETQEPVEGNKMIKSYEDSFSDVHLKPPSRKWQSLSDEEIEEIHTASIGKDIGFATGLTEAKLREKNNGGM